MADIAGLQAALQAEGTIEFFEDQDYQGCVDFVVSGVTTSMETMQGIVSTYLPEYTCSGSLENGTYKASNKK